MDAVEDLRLRDVFFCFDGNYIFCAAQDTDSCCHDPGWIGHFLFAVDGSSFAGVAFYALYFAVFYSDYKRAAHRTADADEISFFHDLILLNLNGDLIQRCRI